MTLARAAAVPSTGVDGGVVRLCLVVLTACTVWGWLVGLAAVRDAWIGAGAPRAGRDGPLRRLVLAACGVAITGALAGPAALASDPHDPLDGLPLPERAVGAGAVLSDRTTSERVVVRAGDTLWSLATRRLSDDATDPAVDAAWRRIYDANLARIGPDPDLILPGQNLRLPQEPA